MAQLHSISVNCFLHLNLVMLDQLNCAVVSFYSNRYLVMLQKSTNAVTLNDEYKLFVNSICVGPLLIHMRRCKR